MKKHFRNLFRREMLRPIGHMLFIRAVLGATAALLWNEFVKLDAARSMRSLAFLFLGLLLLFMGWMAYLRLDGLRVPSFDRRLFEWKRKPKRIRGDLIDFVDEDVVSFDELEEDEKNICRLVADLLCGAVFLVLSGL